MWNEKVSVFSTDRGQASTQIPNSPATGEITPTIKADGSPFDSLALEVQESLQRSARILAEGALRLVRAEGGRDEAL